MLKFLSYIRRTFLAGILSLITILVLSKTNYQGITYQFSDIIGKVFFGFCLISVPLGIIFWLISAIYIRKKGQMAVVHQRQPFFKTMMRMLGHDITFPFRQLPALFTSQKTIARNYSQVLDSSIASSMAEGSKAITRLRVLSFIVRLAICLFGIATTIGLIRILS